MADLKKLADGFYVAGQISDDDIAAAKDLGVSHVICNRPDDEEFGQPNVEEVAAWAASAGMTMEHIPLGSDGLSPDMISATMAALNTDGAILAYCRTGNRSSILWSLAMAKSGEKSPEEILSAAEAAGYDLSHLVHVLESFQDS